MGRMSRRTTLIATAVVTMATALLVQVSPASAATGIHVSGQAVVESTGKSFMMRGSNQPHDWYPSQTSSSLQSQKSWGANTVRVVLSGGRYTKSSASDVAGVVSTCKSNVTG